MEHRMLGLLLLTLTWITPASAVPVSLSFGGTITGTDPTGPYAGLTGSMFSGGITYDSVSGPNQYPGPNADIGDYTFIGAPYGYFVNLPGASIVHVASAVGVNDQGAGFYPSDTIELSTKKDAVGYLAALTGPDNSFSGMAIPDANLIASFWTSGSFIIESPNLQNWLTGAITSVTVVPEPSAYLLIMAGFFGLLAVRRRPASA